MPPKRRTRKVGRPRKKTKKRVVKRRVRRRVKGKGIFGDIKKGIMKAGRFLKKHKVISRGANIWGKAGLPFAEQAKKVGKYAGKAGFGMRKKAPYRKIKGGGLRQSGGNLGRAGGALVRAGRKAPIRRRAYANRRRGTGMKAKTSFP
jgi:hypothetical protein